MVKREKYLKEIRPFYESDLIKIITGIRRCGKSVILKSIYDEIAEKTDNILYLDFEDAFTLKDYGTVEKLLSFVEENRKKRQVLYLFG